MPSLVNGPRGPWTVEELMASEFCARARACCWLQFLCACGMWGRLLTLSGVIMTDLNLIH